MAVGALRWREGRGPIPGLPASWYARWQTAPQWLASRRWVVIAVIMAAFVMLAGQSLTEATRPPTLGVQAGREGERLVVSWVQPTGLAWDAGVRPGHSIVAINGQAASGSDDPAMVAAAPVLEVRDNAGQVIAVSTADYATPVSARQQAVFLAIAACFVTVGGAVYILATDVATARILLAFTVAAALALVAAVAALSRAPWAIALTFVSFNAFGATTFLLFLAFPINRLAVRAGRRAAGACLGALSAFAALYGWVVICELSAWVALQRVAFTGVGVSLLGAVALIVAAVVQSKERREVRRVLGLVAFGVIAGLAPFVVLSLIPLALGMGHVVEPGIAILSIVLLPMSLGAAVLSRQFLGIDRLVRRGLVALAVWMTLLALYSVGVNALHQTLEVHWRDLQFGLGVAAVLVALVGGTFVPAQAWLRHALERLLFRDVYQYSATLQRLSAEVVQLGANEPIIAEHILDRLGKTLDLSWAAVALSGGLALPAPLYRRGKCPDDLDAAALLTAATGAAGHAPDTLGAGSVVPLLGDGELIGALAIGPKRRDVDLSPEDRALLATLAPLFTTAFKNAGLVRSLEAQVAALAEREAALQESNGRLEATLAELKAAQEQVVQQERLRALGEMASGIAHDFNNALTPVVAYADLLLDDATRLDDPQRVRKYLELIYRAGQDAASVVRRLRDFYRQAQPSEYAVAVNVGQVIEQVVALTQPRWRSQALAEGRTITVELDLQVVPPIGGDEAELREAVTNLIFNAVDAMPEGGTITIRTRPDGEHVLIEVEDTGTGMPDDVRRRCLDPFFTTKGERGSGLGLSMVHGIVRRHEGTLSIASELAVGTTFSIRLPVRPEQTSGQTDEPAPREPTAARRLRILVIDDELTTREVMTAYLTRDGHSVETAASGREGLESFRRQPFDLVMTDRAMPVMNGDDLATAIKQLAPSTPVVMVTGFGDLMLGAGKPPAGVDAVLGKPVPAAALRDVLARYTGER
ncbi:MAG: ATP-binding protein [Chloroflexota bacterium]